MKYGVICAKNAKNIGDDIQTYAAAKLIPKVDYYVEREEISSFKSKNNEPVAVIMNAWWMWKKWNWPPSKCIIPKLVSMHFTEWTTENWGSPIKYEIFQNIGAEFLNSYGPVGCRDMNTLNILKKYNIDAYFSGCLTLTLPKQKKIKNKRDYICAVDLDSESINKIKSMIGENVDLKIFNHDCITDKERNSWSKRMNNVEKLLTIYQNAKCVITSRLHAALPSLAMEVPVLLVRGGNDWNRFDPYLNLCNFMTPEDFCNGNYDILNPPENKKDYLVIRNNLIKEINEFVFETSKIKGDLSKIIKTKYTDEDVKRWQYNLMKDTLDKWFAINRDMLSEYNKTIDYLRLKENEIYNLKNSTSWKITKPIRKFKERIEKIKNRQ